jgi:hypothetical protein
MPDNPLYPVKQLEESLRLSQHFRRVVNRSERELRRADLEADPTSFERIFDLLKQVEAGLQAGVQVTRLPLRCDVCLERPSRPPLLPGSLVVAHREACVIETAQRFLRCAQLRPERLNDRDVPLVLDGRGLLDAAGLGGSVDAGSFRRYGSARQLYHFHIDKAGSY